MTDSDSKVSPTPSRDFIRQIIDADLKAGLNDGRLVTRFPPEPNGFLHIGHAKSIVLNFGLAQEYPGGRCHLRFDDTNPTTEDERYVDAIREDVRWLGYDWDDALYFASDYFEEMYALARELIRKGLAYVDSQPEDVIREGRGTVTEPGRESPWRNRSVEENLGLFQKMREGVFANGEHVLRGRIDMASPNMLMRDPVLYRIRHAEHFRTGEAWCIYPLYDFAHPLEDALEGVTHSLCTLEFANNRELYDWVVEQTGVPHRPRQYEFARLNLDYTVMSKRRLRRLVECGDVSGWDDPRMPTLAGLRRRGFTPQSIRTFCEMIGVARSDSRVDMAKLEYAIRDDLNHQAPRVLAVLKPLRVTLTNWEAAGGVESIEAPHFPRDVPREGVREVPFSDSIYIDRDDFSDDPPPGFHRLVPGGEVRLRYAGVIRCDEVIRDPDGRVTELRCSLDPDTWGGSRPKGRRVKGTIQWVSAPHAVRCEVRMYDRLFTIPDPISVIDEGVEPDAFRSGLNPGSLAVVSDARIEPSIQGHDVDTRYQFERVGYFWRDPEDSTPDRPVFNRIVTLRDTWSSREGASSGDHDDAAAGASGAHRTAGERADPSGAVASAPSEGARPEVPPEVRARAAELMERHGLDEVDAEILARSTAVVAFLEEAVERYAAQGDSDSQKTAGVALANWIINELPPLQGDRDIDALPFRAGELAELVRMVEDGTLSSRGGREVLEVLALEGGRPDEIVDRLDLAQIRDVEVLAPVVEELILAHPDKATAYRNGKTGLMGFFMGRLMDRTQGRADPELARTLLREALG